MQRALFVFAVAAVAGFIRAQQSYAMGLGPSYGAGTGTQVGSTGDLDNDGVPDFYVTSPGLGRLDLYSGATLSVRSLGSVSAVAVTGTRDMNLDGVADLVVGTGNTVLAYSGTTLSLLWSLPFGGTPADVGDLDGDGRGDVAVLTSTSAPVVFSVRTLRGSNGSQIGISAMPSAVNAFIAIGDVTGDGRGELAITMASGLRVMQAANFATVSSHVIGGFRLAAANLAGDARNEVLTHNMAGLSVIDATSGAIVRQFTGGGPQGDFAAVGDLNGDGVPDLALTGGPGIEFVFGAVGWPQRDLLSTWPSTTFFPCQRLAGVGDVTGDGVGDLLMGSPAASPPFPPNGSLPTGGWQLLSGRVLAAMSFLPTSCGQGPFLPQLGITRPIVGTTVTVAGRDAPAGTVGFLAMSPQPITSWSLGVPGCDVWLQWGEVVVVHQPVGTMWQLTFPIPMVPQLAGVEFALQALYAPTLSAVGFDLSNGVWARIGY
jgi:hypothetical protein